MGADAAAQVAVAHVVQGVVNRLLAYAEHLRKVTAQGLVRFYILPRLHGSVLVKGDTALPDTVPGAHKVSNTQQGEKHTVGTCRQQQRRKRQAEVNTGGSLKAAPTLPAGKPETKNSRNHVHFFHVW